MGVTLSKGPDDRLPRRLGTFRGIQVDRTARPDTSGHPLQLPGLFAGRK